MRLTSITLLLALGPGAALAQDQERFDCLIDPGQVLEIGSAVDGVIDQVFVSRGDTVKKGDPIAKLESKAEEAQLTYARERAQDEGRSTSRAPRWRCCKRPPTARPRWASVT